ncbi:MAG: zinc ribbon domain-containing protein [Ktedonobacteraceae bacterium]
MRCPRCSNEVSPNEAFCGQCGTPMSLPAQSTETVNTSVPRTGLPGAYNSNNPNYPNMSQPLPPGQGTYPSQMPPSSMYSNTTMPAPPSGQLAPNQQQPQQPAGPFGPQQPQQQTGFYQDATEAITSLPPNRSQGYPPGYQQPQQRFTGIQGQSGFAGGGQYNAQVPYQTTNFPPPNYPTSATPPDQGYGTPSRSTPPPKKQTSAVLVFAIVALVVAIITVSAFGAIFLLRNHGSKTAIIPTVVPTVAATPTTMPSPTPSPVPTVTPTPVPSPTVAPTPTPDANFAWCISCTANGFLVEYPQGWNQTNDGATTNIRFTNPGASDQYAEFKTPGVAQSNASQLVANDLQATYASQQNYQPPTGKSTATIGGENWIYETATYQLNGQQEQVQVYATVHQQNAYIIELEAATSQFPTVSSQSFSPMLGRFQFQQPTS